MFAFISCYTRINDLKLYLSRFHANDDKIILK